MTQPPRPFDGREEPVNGREEWWTDIDDAIVGCLAEHGAMSPKDLARHMGVSESSATSLICLLASAGRVRICLVEDAQMGARNDWERVA